MSCITGSNLLFIFTLSLEVNVLIIDTTNQLNWNNIEFIFHSYICVCIFVFTPILVFTVSLLEHSLTQFTNYGSFTLILMYLRITFYVYVMFCFLYSSLFVSFFSQFF